MGLTAAEAAAAMNVTDVCGTLPRVILSRADREGPRPRSHGFPRRDIAAAELRALLLSLGRREACRESVRSFVVCATQDDVLSTT